MKKSVFILLTGIIIIAMIAQMNVAIQPHNQKQHIKPQSKPQVCVIDTSEAYLVFWEKIFLTRDQVWNEYQNNHIAAITIGSII